MRRLTFSDGIGITLVVLGIGALWVFAIKAGAFEAMYRDFGPSARLPAITTLVFHKWFQIGVPTLLMAATAGALLLRPRFALLAVGVVSIAAAVFAWIAIYQPIWALAGNITAD